MCHTKVKRKTEIRYERPLKKAFITLIQIVKTAKINIMPIPNKKTGEKQSSYMIRCVPQMMRYHDKAQAIAICYRSFQGKMINLETYNDYPQSASNNAKKVFRWRDKHKDEVKGMTQIGWTRANQLAKKENIS